MKKGEALNNSMPGGVGGRGGGVIPWEVLKYALESPSSGQTVRYFNSPDQEMEYIQKFQRHKDALQEMIDSRGLLPIETVTIPPQTILSLVCCFQAPNSVSQDAHGALGDTRSKKKNYDALHDEAPLRLLLLLLLLLRRLLLFLLLRLLLLLFRLPLLCILPLLRRRLLLLRLL